MSERITDRFLRGQVDTINRLLGFDPESVRWDTIGSVQLYGAYGSTAVHRIMNDAGGVTDLSGLHTKREVSLFLAGMIAALYVMREIGGK
jgi:hypothetical protein